MLVDALIELFLLFAKIVAGEIVISISKSVVVTTTVEKYCNLSELSS